MSYILYYHVRYIIYPIYTVESGYNRMTLYLYKFTHISLSGDLNLRVIIRTDIIIGFYYTCINNNITLIT